MANSIANTIKIVEITVAHYDALNKFSTEVGERYYPVFSDRKEMDLILTGGSGFNFVALEGNQIVGYVISDCSYKLSSLDKFGYALLMDFVVENTHRTSAIASALLECFASRMKARGLTKLLMAGDGKKRYKVKDLDSLAMFRHLTTLEIKIKTDDDLRSLADLSQLSELTLNYCLCEDYSVLSKLTQLTYLEIRSLTCKDFQFLLNLTQLKHLNIFDLSLGNKEIDIISNLSQLSCLNIGGGSNITDISPLSKLENLRELYFCYSPNIQDFAPIGRMSNLRLLSFINMGPNFSDITFLRSLPHLTDLSIIARNGSLNLSRCNFSVISDLINLTRLDLSRNYIYDISFLAPLSNLTYLNLEGNIIEDLSPLDALKQQGLKELRVSRKKGYDFSYHGQEEV